MSVSIVMNGEPVAIQAETVIDLLNAEGIDPGAKGVAVAINGNVVRRGDWPNTAVSDGDEVEIVKPFSGG